MSITPGTRLGPHDSRPGPSAHPRRVQRSLGLMLLALAVPCHAFGQATTGATMPARTYATQVQTPNSSLRPEHKKLEIWIGDWTYQGEDKQTSFQPARAYTGRTSVRPILGGAFVEWDAAESNDAGPWREIDGYDSTAKRFFWHAYYPDGTVDVMTYTIDGNFVSLSGTTDIDGKRARLKGTCVFAPDGKSFVEKLQVSLDGKSWIPAWEMRFAKVK